jgi:hypothetical protein
MLFRSFLTALVSGAILITAPLVPGRLSGQVEAGVKDSQVLFRHKHWEVSLIAFDDGTFSCLAQVGGNNSSFLVWADVGSNASLQFYNTAWSFNNEVADIVVRIDSRPSWTLNNADLNQNSVFFNLNDSDASYRFLREVMRGNYLSLFSSSGSRIERYSLAGSSASIVALSDCVDTLKSMDGDNNPFN